MTIAEYRPWITRQTHSYITVDNLIDMMGAGWLLTDLRPAPFSELPSVYATLVDSSAQVSVLVMDDGVIGEMLDQLM